MHNPNHAPVRAYARGEYRISTDQGLLDLDRVHHYLAEESYWAHGEPRELVARALANSLCYGVYQQQGSGVAQVGLGRVITDFATYAYLTDVFILPDHRWQGLGKWLVECILANPDFQELRIFSLYTADAHALYTPFGFQPNPLPQNHLMLRPRRRPHAPISDS